MLPPQYFAHNLPWWQYLPKSLTMKPQVAYDCINMGIVDVAVVSCGQNILQCYCSLKRSLFINELCLLISTISNFVIFFFPKRKPQMVNSCSNSDPSKDFQNTFGEGYIDILSIILYICINIRIGVYKNHRPDQKLFFPDAGSIVTVTRDKCCKTFLSLLKAPRPRPSKGLRLHLSSGHL